MRCWRVQFLSRDDLSAFNWLVTDGAPCGVAVSARFEGGGELYCRARL